MPLFFLALALFLVTHVVPAVPSIRGALIEALGRRAYLALYFLISIVLLGFLIVATLRLDYVPLWDSAPWQAWVTLVLTPIGIFFLLAGLFSPNALSISVRRGDLEPGAIIAITRHPLLWGFMLWSFSHLFPNGDLRGVLLFGPLFLFALVGVPLAERRARKRLGDRWARLAVSTSIVPFVAIGTGRAPLRVDLGMVAALMGTIALATWLLAGGHDAMFGVDPLALALA